jgi:hypothetical protein
VAQHIAELAAVLLWIWRVACESCDEAEALADAKVYSIALPELQLAGAGAQPSVVCVLHMFC